MGLKSRVGGKLSGAAKKADMLGAVAGYLGTIVTAGAAYGNTDSVSEIVLIHKNALMRHNVGALNTHVQAAISDPAWNPILYTGVGLGVAGIVGSYLPSVAPWQGTISSFAKKLGFGLAIGSVLAIITGGLALGSSPFDSGTTSTGSTASGSVTTAGRYTKPTGQFNPPSPSVGAWSRPSQ